MYMYVLCNTLVVNITLQLAISLLLCGVLGRPLHIVACMFIDFQTHFACIRLIVLCVI